MSRPPTRTEVEYSVAVYWPGRGYGGRNKCPTMEAAEAKAAELISQGYGPGSRYGAEVHIVRTTWEVIVWNPTDAN